VSWLYVLIEQKTTKDGENVFPPLSSPPFTTLSGSTLSLLWY